MDTQKIDELLTKLKKLVSMKSKSIEYYKMIYIDNIKEKDVEAILLISNQSEYIQLNENNIYFYLESPIYTCLAIHDDNIMLGFIIISVIEDESEIIDLIISEKHQRQGFAQILLNNSIDIIIKKNVSHIYLEVHEDNSNAIKFYKKNNFVEISIRHNYYNYNKSAIIMNKDIIS